MFVSRVARNIIVIIIITIKLYETSQDEKTTSKVRRLILMVFSLVFANSTHSSVTVELMAESYLLFIGLYLVIIELF